MSETCVRLTRGNYVIKSCLKWFKKLHSNYVWKLRQDYVTNISLELPHEFMLDLR